MIQPVKTVPEILRSTQSAANPSRKPIRILVCGIPKGVESIVQRLHI